MSIRFKLSVIPFFTLLFLLGVLFSDYYNEKLVSESQQRAQLVDRGSYLLQRLFRGLNETILTEGTLQSVEISKHAMRELDSVIGKLGESSASAEFSQRVTLTILPQWHDLKTLLTPFLQINGVNQNDYELMIQYGRALTLGEKLQTNADLLSELVNEEVEYKQNVFYMVDMGVMAGLLLMLMLFFFSLYHSIVKPLEWLQGLMEQTPDEIIQAERLDGWHPGEIESRLKMEKVEHLPKEIDALIGAFGLMLAGIGSYIEKHEKSQRALAELNATLERRVKDRTALLTETNKELRQEISEREMAQLIYKRLQHEHELILASAGEGVYGIDNHGLITFVNPVACEMLGYTAEELKGRKHHDYTCHGDVSEANEMCHLCEERCLSESNASDACSFIAKDGRVFPVDYVSSPIIEHGVVRGAVILFKDVTERKQVETELASAHREALDAAQVKAMFLANMSHEIRTPLNGILGMLNLLCEMELEPDAHEYAEVAYNSSEMLLNILNDVLDVSKIDSGMVEFEAIDFDLHSLVEESCSLHSLRAGSKGLGLACVIEANVPQSINGDPTRIRQVVSNLVSNAIKFTASGGVLVRLSLAMGVDTDAEVNSPKLLFEVIDSGIGIEPSAKIKIFESFRQADGSTTRQFGGTGLGLAIAKQLVELMGGEIDVESQPGEGARFYFDLPMTPATNNPQSLYQHPDLSAITILACLSHSVDAQAVTHLLQVAGGVCELADDIDQFRSRLSERGGSGGWDLILLDNSCYVKLTESDESLPLPVDTPLLLVGLNPSDNPLPHPMSAAMTLPIRQTGFYYNVERLVKRKLALEA